MEQPDEMDEANDPQPAQQKAIRQEKQNHDLNQKAWKQRVGG